MGVAVASAVVGLAVGGGTAAATTESTFPLADPGTVSALDGTYVTWACAVPAGATPCPTVSATGRTA